MAATSDKALAGLKEKLLIMASYAEAAVNRAVKALVRRDDDLARRTKEEDDRIDALEKEIDDDALRLLVKAPSAFHLRFITTAMKIAQNLERVGDEATTISRRVIDLGSDPQLKQADSIPPMATLAVRMLKDALDAFVTRDSAKARAVIPSDKRVDDMNKRLHKELTVFMTGKPATISRCLNLMVICKSLERIGDHATNVAEEVVYLYEGRDIRHQDIQVPAAKKS
ncbi:MAG: phosphate transport system protein [Verrucomicrobiota bacterium]|jgi:phosphate transport system protein